MVVVDVDVDGAGDVDGSGDVDFMIVIVLVFMIIVVLVFNTVEFIGVVDIGGIPIIREVTVLGLVLLLLSDTKLRILFGLASIEPWMSGVFHYFLKLGMGLIVVVFSEIPLAQRALNMIFKPFPDAGGVEGVITV